MWPIDNLSELRLKTGRYGVITQGTKDDLALVQRSFLNIAEHVSFTGPFATHDNPNRLDISGMEARLWDQFAYIYENSPDVLALTGIFRPKRRVLSVILVHAPAQETKELYSCCSLDRRLQINLVTSRHYWRRSAA